MYQTLTKTNSHIFSASISLMTLTRRNPVALADKMSRRKIHWKAVARDSTGVNSLNVLIPVVPIGAKGYYRPMGSESMIKSIGVNFSSRHFFPP